jgi:Flp pilus assembly protein TadD
VAAYNNLGVVYGRLNDVRHQEDALQKAVNLNDHFAPAFVNLARLQITQRKFADAETKLQTATTLEPTNVESLTLLAYCQLLNQQNAAAIVTAHRADALPNHPAFVHYVAARAQEHLNHLPEAASELSEFLKQEPQGARADHARQELAGIQRAIAHRD